MNPLATRVVSALVAFAVLVALVYFFEANGLKMLCCLAPVLAQRELSRLLFKDEDSRLLKWAFSLALLIIFACTAFYPNNAALVLGLTTVVFCSLTLFYEKYFNSSCTIQHFGVQPIEQISDQGQANDISKQRKLRKQFWMKELSTVFPFGLNNRCQGQDWTKSDVAPYF